MAADSAPSRAGTVPKVALLVLVVVVIGWPVNTLFSYAILAGSALLIFAGTVTSQIRPWLFAVVLAVLSIAAQFILSPPRIEEGHNIFLPRADDNALTTGLPPEVYRLMAEQFDALYPPSRRCDPQRAGCWQGMPMPDRTFAFSADGVFGSPQYSRRVDRIDFADPVWHRLGFINELRYNWTTANDGVERAQRDRRFWMGLHRWQLKMPYFVMYRFPPDYVGSQLCWRGDIVWEEGTDRFTPLSHSAWACRVIEKEDVGRRIFGLAIKPGTLAMDLERPLSIALRQLAVSGLVAGVTVTILVWLLSWRARALVVPLLVIGAGLLTIVIDDASFVGGVRPFDGGDDGLFYDGMARRILTSLLDGNIMQAIEGGEKVFYYGGPGFRYLRALEHVIFGETYFGYLSLILAFPLVLFALFNRFVPRVWALACLLIFMAIPIGAIFGTSFFHYMKNASRGYADPAAAIAAVCGTLVLVGWTAAGPGRRLAPAFWAAFLLALAVFMRPNIAPYVGVLGAGAGVMALLQAQWARAAGLAAGIAPASFMPWHNWYFGKQFVLFSGNAQHEAIYLMLPSTYLQAGAELVTLNFGGEHLRRAVIQLADWLSGVSGSYAATPIGAAAVAIIIFVAARKAFDPWLRLISAATLAQHGVMLFYATTQRYHLLTWLMSYVIVTVWLHAVGVPWLRRRYAAQFYKFENAPVMAGITRSLEEFDRATAP